MANLKLNPIRKLLGIIIALGLAGTFFSILGAAPGYENMFRALMMIVTLSIVILASRALTTIKSRQMPQNSPFDSRHFYNITLQGESK